MMIGTRFVAVSCVLLFVVAAASAQQRPNFSGRWVAVSPADAAGEEQIIKHDATSLTIGHSAEGGADHSLTYILDGKENRTTMPSHGSEIVILYKAMWKGEHLSIVSAATYPHGGKLDQTMLLSIDAKGQLVMEVTEAAPGKPTNNIRVVHQKK